MSLISMPIFIGMALSFLVSRLGVKLALAMTILGIVGSLYAIFALVVFTGMDLIDVPLSDPMIGFALEAFPANTPGLLAAVFAARTAQWVFRMKLAAIRYYMTPRTSLL